MHPRQDTDKVHVTRPTTQDCRDCKSPKPCSCMSAGQAMDWRQAEFMGTINNFNGAQSNLAEQWADCSALQSFAPYSPYGYNQQVQCDYLWRLIMREHWWLRTPAAVKAGCLSSHFTNANRITG